MAGYRAALLAALALLLASCASQPPEPKGETAEKPVPEPDSRYAVEHDFAPLRPITADEVMDAIPAPDPILAVGNMSPYVIGGVTYEILQDYRGYREQGIASFDQQIVLIHQDGLLRNF